MKKKKIITFLLCFLITIQFTIQCFAVPTPPLTAEGAILLEPRTNTVLYDKNGSSKFYPASTTKILTTLLLLEDISPVDSLTKTAASIKNIPSDSSHIGLVQGDKYSYLDGIHAILLASDNFVSYDMAISNAGNIEAFAQKMNEKALSLGAVSSHFVNPHGYHDPEHYTTPYDLALIAKAAFSNPNLAQIAGSTTYDFTILNNNKKIPLKHTSELLHTSSPYYNSHVIATKTGFHTPAGRVLVAKANYDGIELIGVVMKTNAPNQFVDMNALFNFGSENFKVVQNSEGQNLVANISFSPWAKAYVEYALDNKWIRNSTKSFQDPLTVREFIGLLSHALPIQYATVLSPYIHSRNAPVYSESLPITQGQVASILYDISLQLGLTNHTLYNKGTIPNLTKLPAPLQEAVKFTTSVGLFGKPTEAFNPHVGLTYEQAIIVTYRLNKLYNTSIPYIFLDNAS